MHRKENSLLSLQVKGGKVSERLQPLRSTIFFLCGDTNAFVHNKGVVCGCKRTAPAQYVLNNIFGGFTLSCLNQKLITKLLVNN